MVSNVRWDYCCLCGIDFFTIPGFFESLYVIISFSTFGKLMRYLQNYTAPHTVLIAPESKRDEVHVAVSSTSYIVTVF